MALTDIVANNQETIILEEARGNVGTVIDYQYQLQEITLVNPAVSDVRSGTLFGRQGAEVGTLTAASISRNRQVN